MKKGIVVLGSTGSVGKNTMEVLEQFPGKFRVCALTANNNWRLLAEQARRWLPDVVVINPENAAELQRELESTDVSVLTAPEGLVTAATHEEAGMVVAAIVGSAGLRPTLEAVRQGKDIALANKEALVAAGPVFTREAREHGACIVPVDSEHNAVFQCLQGGNRKALSRIILTASGGPFLGHTRDQLQEVKPEEAVAHPRWNMGQKISVDSATLMNKGLEVIEAQWLFSVSVDRIDVVVHPESIVHSLVELVDGAVLAHLNLPNMRHPIQHALTYPERVAAPGLSPLSLAEVGRLTFEKPDMETFQCLRLALQAANVGGTMPAVLNAANEVCVEAFLQERLAFLDIARLIERTMEAHAVVDDPGLDDILSADRWARKHVRELLEFGGHRV